MKNSNNLIQCQVCGSFRVTVTEIEGKTDVFCHGCVRVKDNLQADLKHTNKLLAESERLLEKAIGREYDLLHDMKGGTNAKE
jgi:hypothetical protein